MSEPVLLYISFGKGPHVDEVIFSVMSAAATRRDADSFQIVIFTDDASPFASLPATCVLFDSQTLLEWIGLKRFNHRRKIFAVGEALRRFQVPVVMVDADTYFRRSPQTLFDRVGPGRSLMHLPEGRIGHLVALGHKRFQLSTLHVQTPLGGDWQIDPEWMMWNSGVVGIDPSEGKLVDLILAVCDAITEATGHINAEQIAFGRILQQHTRVRPCRDVVFHYHEWFIRDGFRKRLPALLEEAAALPADGRANWLLERRPRPPLKKTITATLKRPLKKLGLFKSDLNSST